MTFLSRRVELPVVSSVDVIQQIYVIDQQGFVWKAVQYDSF